MSTWSSGSLGSEGVGSLPAPAPRVFSKAFPSNVFDVLAGSPSNLPTLQVQATRQVRISAVGIPQNFIEDPTFDLQLELLRYRRKVNRAPNSLSSSRLGGYVHPTHNPAPSGNGSFTHGGDHQVSDPVRNLLRPTEWKVTSANQTHDVTQGMLGHMMLSQIMFRNPTGAFQFIEVLIPTTNSRQGTFGKFFGYSSAMSPGYFKFRWSIRDKSDPRGKRIHGPESVTVSCSNTIFPFTPQPPLGGLATVLPRSGFTQDFVNFWLGSVSRLPT